MVAKVRELSNGEIDAASIETLRAAYKELRDHHVAETMELIEKLREARRETSSS
jgi:hypothetical protein